MKKFLLHTCCAPCSIAVIDELKKQFELTVFFYNPNIFPEEEYFKRKNEVIKFCGEWGVAMVDMDNETETWNKKIAGLEKEPEGGARCPICFAVRLEKSAAYAAEKDFDVFGTSLTSGRNKKAEVIHPLGHALAKKYGIIFFDEDWKKNGRQELGRKMVNERGIYRQNYCGCRFSLPETK